MEVFATELSPWGFLYDLIMKVAFFVGLPYLVALMLIKERFFKILLIIISIYSILAIVIIVADYGNDYAFVKDYNNDSLEVQEFYVAEIDYEVKRLDYFVIDGNKYRFLISRSDDFWDENFEGHLCEVEYYETSRRVVRIKVID